MFFKLLFLKAKKIVNFGPNLDQFVNTFGPFLCRTSGNPASHCSSMQQQSSRAVITLRKRYSLRSVVHTLISAELPRHDHSIIACSCHAYIVFFFAHSVVNCVFQRNATGEVATALQAQLMINSVESLKLKSW